MLGSLSSGYSISTGAGRDPRSGSTRADSAKAVRDPRSVSARAVRASSGALIGAVLGAVRGRGGGWERSPERPSNRPRRRGQRPKVCGCTRSQGRPMRCTGHRTTGAGTLPTGADTTFEAVARAGPVPCRGDTECAPGWPRRRGQVPQGRRLRHAGCTTRPGRSGGPSTMARPPRSRPRDNGGCALGRQDGIGQVHEALRRPARAMVGWATMDDSADAGRWAQGSVLVGGLPLRWSAASCSATERPVRSAIPADVACSWRTGDAAVENGGAEGHAHPSRRRAMSKHRPVAHPATAGAHEVSRGSVPRLARLRSRSGRMPANSGYSATIGGRA